MEVGKVFLEILSPCASASHFCVYVCTIIMHIICEWHGKARGGDSLQLKNGKKVDGVLTPFISKNRHKFFIFDELHIIINCNIYIDLSMFIKQNFTIFEQ